MEKIILFLKKYIFLLGIIIFLIIISRTNLTELWLNVKKIKLSFLVIALLLDFPMITVKAWCWNYIKKQQGINYSLKNSTLMYFAGLYAGSFTPAKLGEIIKAFYLKKDGFSLGKSIVGIILDRFSDFIFLIVIVVISSLFFINILSKQIIISIFLAFLSMVILFIFIKLGLLKIFFKKAFSFFVPQKKQESWNINFQDFTNDLKNYNTKNYIVIIFITAFSWIFYYLQMYLLSLSAGIKLPFLYLAMTVTITGFIGLIPISISGIGTRDAALILLLSPFMIPTEKIIVFSFIILLAYLFTTLLGLICWLIKPVKI